MPLRGLKKIPAAYSFLSIADVILSIKSSKANEVDLVFLLRTVHYLWRGVAPKRNVFRGKNFADPTIKKVKNLITQPQISIKK
jgi:hypothetical protein